jgi:hypothetical protein
MADPNGPPSRKRSRHQRKNSAAGQKEVIVLYPPIEA